jgi:hypothetical protein
MSRSLRSTGVGERWDWPVARADERVRWSLDRVRVLRTEIADWFARRRSDARFARFGQHFDVLDKALGRMLDAVQAELHQLVDEFPGHVHERCRGLDIGLSHVQRLHAWYAAKYDQRLDHRLAPTLQAADEIVRSCWSEPFAALGLTPPTGPVAYLEPRYDATATPRVSVPPDLRAPDDSLVALAVGKLPVPVIALPAICVAEPWWLVLAVHETGHHVQTDLAPGLVRATREALHAAGSDDWYRWSQEVFADAFSVLMVGSAAAWAVGELQHAPDHRLGRVPGTLDRYPPPAVRMALLGELARCAGVPDPGPGVDDVRRWLDRADLVAGTRSLISGHLDVTAAVARALIELPVQGMALRDLCGYDTGAAAQSGDWARALVADAPMIAGRGDRAAARIGIAGGVAAYRADPSHAAALHRNLAAQLAGCGPSGHLAAAPAADVDAVADSLAEQLVAAAREAERG